MNNVSRYILASVLLTLALHLVLLFWCGSMQVRNPMSPVEDSPQEKLISLHLVSPLAPEPLPLPEVKSAKSAADGKGAESLREDGALGEKAIQEILEREKITLQLPPPKIQMAGIAKGQAANTDLPKPIAPEPAQAPRPKIVQIDASEIPAPKLEGRELVPDVERIDVSEVQLPSLLPPGPELSGSSGSYSVGLRLPAPSFRPPDLIPEEPPSEELSPGGAELETTTIVPEQESEEDAKPSPFDGFVNVKVAVQDDKATGGGYFKLTIQANENSEAVAEVPLDTLFIIDHSISISQAKLQEFKTAARNALEYLNPRDRFNIVTFNDKAKTFTNRFIPASRHNVEVAGTFLSRIAREGTTDVFGGIHPFVKSSNGEPGRPLNIYLLTDGVSTVNIYKKEDFLKKIVGINPGNVSIHTFSAGKEANRELLDYLALLNHGYSWHAPEVSEVNSRLTAFIASLGHLLISDMRYIAPEAIAKEIYPRELPHLYRNAPLQLYGRFSSADKNLVVTIQGRDAGGKLRDLVFTRRFDQCERTEDDIARVWAARKIFQLLTDKVLSENPAEKKRLEQEIKKLKSSFSIAVPYN